MIALSAAAFGLCGALCVSAASADKAPERNLTLKEMSSSMPGDSKAEYMEHAALVMFKGEQQLTKETASSELKAQSDTGDLQIEELWCLKDTGASKPGLQTQSSASYRSVALVTSRTLSTEQLIQQLKARDDVLYAEPNYQAYACSVDDPWFNSQWSMKSGEHTPNVQSVWDSGTTGSNRIVAVLDSGVDYTHPDLVNRMWKNKHYPTLKGTCGFDFIDGDDDPMDEHRHGTHCAGIIGAQGNNGEGICGVNQDIRIMALRALDADGTSRLNHFVAAYDYISKALDLGEPVQAINNSWGTAGYSDILEELIDIVGRKGAVSVCAAGNEGANNDVVPSFPCCFDSPYVISVAATKEDGELAGYSNYGEQTVDVAAPGADILSAVNSYVYNPTIYGEEQDKYTDQFNDYESEDGWEAVSELKDNLYLNGERFPASNPGKRKISLTRCEDGFQMSPDGGTGHSIFLEAKNLEKGDLICIPIPCEIGPESQMAPYFSVMVKPAVSTKGGSGTFGVVSLPQDTPLDNDTLLGLPMTKVTINNNYFDFWRHLSSQIMKEDELRAAQTESGVGEAEPLKRKLVLTLYTKTGGDFRLCLDDLGLSRQDLSGPEVFGKYDFLNGTSMATPFISGAVCLYAAQQSPSFISEDAQALTSEVISLSKEGKLPIVQGGSFDFTKKPKELFPRIGSIDVDSAAGSIIITGTGLNPSTGLKVELGPDENSLREASILSQSSQKVVVKDEGWMNNVVSLRVTGYNGKAVSYNGWYLVDGKGSYITAKDAEVAFSGEPMATDGRYIYFANSTELSILTLDTEKLSKGAQTIAVVPNKVFQWQKDQMSPYYVMQFGSDLVYCNGKLYSVVEYGEAEPPEYVIDKDSGEIVSDDLAIYSSRLALISVDVSTGKVTNLGILPSELLQTEDFTMAAYNGALLFLGGYSHELHNLTTAVRVYTPGKGWSEGTALPQPRAGGKALQVGSRLVYTLGYSAPLDEASSAAPANLVFDGKRWSVSSVPTDQGIQSLTGTGIVVRDHREYPTVQASVGAAKDGLVYMGLPAANYGDTFVYNVSKDCFADTGYNYMLAMGDPALAGIAVGETLYGFDGMNVLTAPLTAGSGFQSVSVSKNKGGKVSGILTVPSGNDAVLTVKADKGYAIASIQVNGKKVKVSNSSKQTLTLKSVQKKQKLQVQFKKAVHITVKTGKGGTVTGSTQLPSGDDASLTVKADKGYRIQSIQVNGKKVKVKNSGKQKITLKRVKKNQVLKVVFRKK